VGNLQRISAPIDDGSLVQAAQRGDRRALEQLLQLHYDRIYAVCRRVTGHDADAADAAQEALIAIVRNIERFDGRAVTRVGRGSQEVVEVHPQRTLELLEPRRVGIHERLGVAAGRFGGQRVLQGMVVGAAEQPDIVTGGPVETCQRIRLHELECVAEILLRIFG